MDVLTSFQFERFLMNDVILFGSILAAVAAAVVSFVFYSVYGGSKASLVNAQEGQIFNFEYEQPLHGESKRFLAKVIEPVYTLSDSSIKALNSRSRYRRNDPVFQRTNHLVTCQTPDGKIRQFYAERVKNCRKPLLAGALFKSGVASLL
jgi:hypothetical protein